MRSSSLLAAARIGFLLLLALVATARAADVKVLSAAAMRPVLNELGPQFERSTGHKLVLQFDVVGALKRKIDGGEPFDVAILTPALVGELVGQGKLAGATRTDIARSGMGVFVQAGRPRPDIATAEAFKRTMLDAKSVAYNKDTPVAAYLPSLFERLGIAEQMKLKILLTTGPGGAPEAVMSGQTELGVSVISAFEPSAQSQLIAPLPPELQNYVVYVGGVAGAAAEAQAGKALIDFLKAPAAAPVLRAKGMEPVAP